MTRGRPGFVTGARYDEGTSGARSLGPWRAFQALGKAHSAAFFCGVVHCAQPSSSGNTQPPETYEDNDAKNERQAAVSMQVTLPPRDRLRLARRRYSSSSPSTRESHQPMRGYYRHTKIIATFGPATESAERLAQLITSGVDVMRLNMAHGSGEWVSSLVKRIRDVSTELGRHVAVMMDVKGPEIRTGVVAEPIELRGRRNCSNSTRRAPAKGCRAWGSITRAFRRRRRGSDRARRQRSHSPRRRGKGRDARALSGGDAWQARLATAHQPARRRGEPSLPH